MKVIFISGPFRAKSAWGVEQNIRRAEELALETWKAGFAVVCPHTNTRYFDGEANDKIWLEGDLEILRRCDAVLTTDDWERSTGAKAEVEEAIKCGVPVYKSLDLLCRWSQQLMRLKWQAESSGK